MKLKIDGWKQHLVFSVSHFLPAQGQCERLHGHTYAVFLELSGELGNNDMLVDFKKLKHTIKEVIDELDHRVIIPIHNPFINITVRERKVEIHFEEREFVFPREDVLLLPISSSSAEKLSQYILEEMVKGLEDELGDLSKICVGVDEGPGQGAWCTKRLG